MKRLIALLLAALAFTGAAQASEGGVAWDRFPAAKLSDQTALQNGARLFVNYCLNCHSAEYMRYNRLRDIGLSEAQIKQNLLFATDKVGETMKVVLDPKEAKAWFGGVPPDLTVIARSRSAAGMGSGADYLYTYLRSYYRDPSKATGLNNLAFPNLGMPHVLWELQGERAASSMVRSGIYRHTRNPMYLGMLFALAAWAVWLASLAALAVLPVFVLYLNRWLIEPEERVLAGLFAGEFAAYRRSVRRWL